VKPLHWNWDALMSEPTPIGLNTPDAGMRQAGDRLREAREQQGLSLDGLASIIKVTPAKLDALEQGRFDLLPDANFARALAMTVCRYLRIDPATVVSGLPAARAIPLTSGKPPLNQPFKDFHATGPLFDRHGSVDWASLLKVKWLAPLLLLGAAAAVYFLPEQMLSPSWLQGPSSPVSAASAVAGATSGPEVQSSAPSAAVASEPVSPASSAQAAASASGTAPAFAAQTAAVASQGASSAPVEASFSAVQLAQPEQPAPVQLHAIKPSWVEVLDGKGGKILSRHMAEGETASVDGVPPLKLRIGNATHVELSFKGQDVDLAAHTRNNVARLELR
jgi:cytoskeleton protein RodZ